MHLRVSFEHGAAFNPDDPAAGPGWAAGFHTRAVGWTERVGAALAPAGLVAAAYGSTRESARRT